MCTVSYVTPQAGVCSQLDMPLVSESGEEKAGRLVIDIVYNRQSSSRSMLTISDGTRASQEGVAFGSLREQKGGRQLQIKAVESGKAVFGEEAAAGAAEGKKHNGRFQIRSIEAHDLPNKEVFGENVSQYFINSVSIFVTLFLLLPIPSACLSPPEWQRPPSFLIP